MRLPLFLITFAVLAVTLVGCGTKTALVLPPAPTTAATPPASQLLPGNHSNAPGTVQ